MKQLPLLQLFVYSSTLWFGLYLLVRDFSKPGLRYAGFGLISYALGLGVAVLQTDPNNISPVFVSWHYVAVLLPAVFWMGATLYLVPDVPVTRININLVMLLVVLVVAALLLALLSPALARIIVMLIPVVFAVAALIRVRQAFESDVPQRPLKMIFTATIFFALGSSLLLIPLPWLSNEWVLLAISIDMLLLGYAVALLDAYDEGTSLPRDMLRSFDATMIAVLLIGGQVVLVMVITEQITQVMVALLFSLITTVIFVVTLFDTLQTALDNLVFASEDHIRKERAQLRAASAALPRVDKTRKFVEMDDGEFTRLTRRALSHYSDLSKLASSPLIQLPLIDGRLQEQDDNILSRANELKTLLRDSIEQLKPDDTVDFSTADEWRYYNVLYFPYVVGIKPYSRRFYREDLDEAATEALDWFKTYVPERTLYNWQKSAAQLVAQHLQEKLLSA